MGILSHAAVVMTTLTYCDSMESADSCVYVSVLTRWILLKLIMPIYADLSCISSMLTLHVQKTHTYSHSHPDPEMEM